MSPADVDLIVEAIESAVVSVQWVGLWVVVSIAALAIILSLRE